MHLEVKVKFYIRPLLKLCGPRCGFLPLDPCLGGGPHLDGGLLLCLGRLPRWELGGHPSGTKGKGSLT